MNKNSESKEPQNTTFASLGSRGTYAEQLSCNASSKSIPWIGSKGSWLPAMRNQRLVRTGTRAGVVTTVASPEAYHGSGTRS